MSRKFVAFLITISIIILLSLIGVGLTYVLRVTNIDNNVRNFLEGNTVSYTTVSTIVSSPVSELDKIPDKIVTYDASTSTLISDILKLSFNYKDMNAGYAVSANRAGNKLSIKSADQKDYQYIELYAKKTTESLTAAVKRIFLDGVPENFCNFTTETTKYNFDTTGLIFGSIVAGTGVKPEQCPTPYTKDTSKGERFFFMNPAFPDRFGFVYVGNTFVPGTSVNSNWFESLKFLQ